MPGYWTGMDGATVDRRRQVAAVQRRLRRRAYWGPDGLSWAGVRLAAYAMIIVASAVLATVVVAELASLAR